MGVENGAGELEPPLANRIGGVGHREPKNPRVGLGVIPGASGATEDGTQPQARDAR